MGEQLLPTILSNQVVICGALASRCVCDKPPKHSSPHECRCGGSWEGKWKESTFRIRSLPDISSGEIWPVD